jgi:hypothetical protein
MDNASLAERRWQEYRRRRNAMVASFASFLVVGLLAVVWPEAPVIGRLGWPLAAVFLVWFWVANFRIVVWPCPRCGAPYFTKGVWFGLLFARHCLHCGLPKWQVPASDAGGA